MTQFNMDPNDKIGQRMLAMAMLKNQQAQAAAETKATLAQQQLAGKEAQKRATELRRARVKRSESLRERQARQSQMERLIADARQHLGRGPDDVVLAQRIKELASGTYADLGGKGEAAKLAKMATEQLQTNTRDTMARVIEADYKPRGLRPSSDVLSKIEQAMAAGTSVTDIVNDDIHAQQTARQNTRAARQSKRQALKYARKLKLHPDDVTRALSNPAVMTESGMINPAEGRKALDQASKLSSRILSGLGRNAGLGIAGVAGLGAAWLGSKVFGGDDKQQIPPEMQMLMAQKLAQAQSGDGGVQTSRTLRDMARMLTMIKSLQQMAGAQNQVEAPPVMSVV